MYRIGSSEDIHRLEENNRPLIISGIKIDYNKGPVSHSDGDIVMHALAEALLGSLALGDLGTHFPDNDPKYKDIDSSIILKESYQMVLNRGWELVNADISIQMDKPKLKPYILKMRENLASLLNVSIDDISIKAQTNEGLDAIGQLLAMKAIATILIRKKN